MIPGPGRSPVDRNGYQLQFLPGEFQEQRSWGGGEGGGGAWLQSMGSQDITERLTLLSLFTKSMILTG